MVIYNINVMFDAEKLPNQMFVVIRFSIKSNEYYSSYYI